MADISRSRRFFAKKRELYAAPVNRSLCCCAPVRIIIGGHGCEACKQPTRAVQVRDLGQVQGARLGDRSALGITQAEAVRAIRDMVGNAESIHQH